MNFNGLPAFYAWMNQSYPKKWALVGGAAAWAYIAGYGNRNFAEDTTVYRDIFPQDIDVLIVGAPPKETITVTIGSFGAIEVQFVEDNVDAVEKCLHANELAFGARALDIGSIIFKYATTSDKAKVRGTRVAMLEAIKQGQIISPLLMKKLYDQTPDKKQNPFALGAAALRKTGGPAKK